MAWLSQHIGTILLAVGIAALLGLIVWRMIANKKAGKSSCGCGCQSCAMKDQCHK